MIINGITYFSGDNNAFINTMTQHEEFSIWTAPSDMGNIHTYTQKTYKFEEQLFLFEMTQDERNDPVIMDMLYELSNAIKNSCVKYPNSKNNRLRFHSYPLQDWRFNIMFRESRDLNYRMEVILMDAWAISNDETSSSTNNLYLRQRCLDGLVNRLTFKACKYQAISIEVNNEKAFEVAAAIESNDFDYQNLNVGVIQMPIIFNKNMVSYIQA